MDAAIFYLSHMSKLSTSISKPLKFVFRWDAGKRIGNGHYMRCMVLSTELMLRGHSVAVLTLQVPLALQAFLDEMGVVVQIIDPDSDGLEELYALNIANRIDWLVIDHYEIDIRWERMARKMTSRIMVIDDLANRPHDCDLLLDQNIPNSLQKGYGELVPEPCVLAIGWEHLLARSSFFTQKVQERSGTLIFLGGGDHSHVLSALLDQLIAHTQYHPLKVLVTSDYLPLAHWESMVADCGQVFCDVLEPVALYSSAKLAVVRCGFISYELALLGIPSVYIYTTAIQAAVALELERFDRGVAIQELHLSDSASLNEAMQRASMLNPQPLNEKFNSGAQVVADLLEHIHEH